MRSNKFAYRWMKSVNLEIFLEKSNYELRMVQKLNLYY